MIFDLKTIIESELADFAPEEEIISQLVFLSDKLEFAYGLEVAAEDLGFMLRQVLRKNEFRAVSDALAAEALMKHLVAA